MKRNLFILFCYSYISILGREASVLEDPLISTPTTTTTTTTKKKTVHCTSPHCSRHNTSNSLFFYLKRNLFILFCYSYISILGREASVLEDPLFEPDTNNNNIKKKLFEKKFIYFILGREASVREDPLFEPDTNNNKKKNYLKFIYFIL